MEMAGPGESCSGFMAKAEAARNVEVKKRTGLTRNGLIEEIFRSEAGEMARMVVFLEGLKSRFSFTKDVIHFNQASEMSFRETFLVRNENVGLGSSDPAGEDTAHEDVGIKAGLLRKDYEEIEDLPQQWITMT